MADQTDKIIEWVENIGNVVAGEIPPFIQEVVRYGIASNMIGFILFLAVTILLSWIVIKWWETLEMFGLFLGIIAIVTAISCVSCLNDIMKATLAPKLYVIHMLKDKNK